MVVRVERRVGVGVRRSRYVHSMGHFGQVLLSREDAAVVLPGPDAQNALWLQPGHLFGKEVNSGMSLILYLFVHFVLSTDYR